MGVSKWPKKIDLLSELTESEAPSVASSLFKGKFFVSSMAKLRFIPKIKEIKSTLKVGAHRRPGFLFVVIKTIMDKGCVHVIERSGSEPVKKQISFSKRVVRIKIMRFAIKK